jgi:hypothetical protein
MYRSSEPGLRYTGCAILLPASAPRAKMRVEAADSLRKSRLVLEPISPRLIDRDRTGYIPRAVKVRSHGYVGAFVKIAARRETGGIKGYLVVLIVTWIDQD